MASVTASSSTAPVPSRGRRWLSGFREKETWTAYLFIFPWVFGFLALTLGPMHAAHAQVQRYSPGTFDGIEIAAATLRLLEQQRPARPAAVSAQRVPMTIASSAFASSTAALADPWDGSPCPPPATPCSCAPGAGRGVTRIPR